MKTYFVEPHKGVGPILLGMTHVKYQEQEAVIAIPGGEVLEGELKPNKGWAKRGLRYTKTN